LSAALENRRVLDQTSFIKHNDSIMEESLLK